uniref:Secreted protein n=1 Tax=Chrysemys picta bellii TaxID=8478 RepID=A0A8C3HDA2_CHRPI
VVAKNVFLFLLIYFLIGAHCDHLVCLPVQHRPENCSRIIPRADLLEKHQVLILKCSVMENPQ